MNAPSDELQYAIVTRLKADSAVTALVAGRIYDHVPDNAGFPRITLGVTDEVSDDADCIEGLAISYQIDCWSRAVGVPQVRNMAHAVRRALTREDIALSDNALVSFEHRVTRTMRDPDGITNHAAITFDVFVEPAA